MSGLRPYLGNRMLSWNPFSDLEEIDRRMFGDSFFSNHDLAAFKTDITDEGSYFAMKADLPGFNKEDIKLDLRGDTLVIHAERHSEHEQKDQQGKYVCCERSYGSYSRSYNVSGIDVDQISASYENGVLNLKLPKKSADTSGTRQITIT